jgi:putative ABC transport system permease protein
LRGLLVGAQLALSLATLAAAALLVRATLRDLSTDPGFRRDGALVATVDLGAIGYDEARSQRFAGEALERFSTLPGVERASLSTFVPMGVSGGGNGRRIEVEGYVPAPQESLAVVADSVGPGYFDTLALALVAGREFAPTDRAGAPPVAVVTETFAARYLPGGALGKRLRVAGEWREIVGVVADATYRSLGEPKLPRLYLPQLQVPETRWTFVLRAAGDPARLAEPLRAALAELDPDLPLGAVQPLAAHASAGLFDRKLVSALLAGMGIIALALAAVGLHGLLAYSVAARRRELAVRSALGAAASDLLRLVLADAGRLVAAGGAAGLLLAWGLSRIVASVFPTVRGFDVAATLGALAVLAATAFVAAWLPARQAGRTQPALVLRDE